MQNPSLEKTIVDNVRFALAEDIGCGDVTVDLIPTESELTARLICRDDAILCGTAWFNEVFKQLDRRVAIDWKIAEGQQMQPNDVVCILSGSARSLLTGERTAINFLQTLSGTATVTANYAKQLAPFKTQILDTRKTIPGLRLAQKYAVTCGGGVNHRLGLYDRVMVKENHIDVSGGIAQAVVSSRKLHPTTTVEVEVETLDELDQALKAGADIILLDNFSIEMINQAVVLNQNRALLEVSGGVELDALASIGETGVDFVSVGNLTKHLQATDFSLRYVDNT